MSTETAAPERLPERSVKDLARAAVSGWLGTTLEYVDFQLYSLAAALVFPYVFFPTGQHPAMAIILAMATYGVGYVSRPLGAWFFGRIGDKHGRAKVLVITIALMGVASTLIGVLPTYEQVGILAPALLVFLRLLQGFGSGAEISGAGVMLAEYASLDRRGLISSLVALGTNSGTLLAALLWAVLLAVAGKDAVVEGLWRIPFLGSFVLLILAVWIRARLKETPVFEARETAAAEHSPVVERADNQSSDTLGRNGSVDAGAGIHSSGETRKGKAWALAFLLRFGEAGNSGVIQTYLVTFMAALLGISAGVSTTVIIYSSLVAFVTVPIVGLLGDRFGRRRVYLVVGSLAMIAIVPALLMITTKETALVYVGFTLLHNLCVMAMFSIENITMCELFGSRSRYTSYALAREVAGIIATGFGPALVASLVSMATGSWIPIAVVLGLFTLAPLVAAFLMPEVRGRDLTTLDNAC